MTKRGRGQRRSRRLKNISTTRAQRMAWQHLRRNPSIWRPAHVVLAELKHYFRGVVGVA